MHSKNRFILFGALRKKFSNRKTIRFAFYFLVALSLVALFASSLCNEKPLYVKYNGVHLFPSFSIKGYADIDNEETQAPRRIVYSTINWRELKKEKVIWCPVAFSPGKSDWINAGYKSPFDRQAFVEDGNIIDAPVMNRHWLGTTKTGADVLSGIIHGARVSLTIGIFSMVIAGFIGILLGAFGGFFGDNKIIVSQSGFLSAIFFGMPLTYFYGIHLNHFIVSSLLEDSYLFIIAVIMYVILIAAICLYVSYVAGKYLGRLIKLNFYTFLRVDQFISRGIEIFNSIPRIVLIITISSILRPSVITLVLIIGFTSWTEIARLVRAEMLKVRESEFIQSAEASGIKTLRLIFMHALPNVILPAFTAITLGVASAILTESALSFLGVGVPGDVVTWGSLLNEGRQNYSAWWLIVFPGLAIFGTVTAINILGDAIDEAIDARKR